MRDLVKTLRFMQHSASLAAAPVIKEAADEIERLRKGIQDYLDGNYEPRLRKLDKCSHGVYGYECCENCVDAHFVKLLAIPQIEVRA